MVTFNGAVFYNSLVGSNLINEIIFGIFAGIGLLISILAHELMHSLVAQRNGLPVKEIELYLFGGVSKITEEPNNPKLERNMAFAGPLTSLGLGGIGIIVPIFINLGVFSSLLFFYLGFNNLILGIFNLIPAFPMDGGRVLRAYLWKRRNNLISATRTASKIGRFIGYLLIWVGIFQVFLLGSLGGIWLVLIGNFLTTSAANAFYQTLFIENLIRLRSDDIMADPYPVINAKLSLSAALKQYFRKFRKNHFFVEEDGRIVGVLHIEMLKKLSNEQFRNSLVLDVMQKIEFISTISGQRNGKEAFELLSDKEDKSDIIIVKEEDSEEIIGMIDFGDFNRAVSLTNINDS